MRGVKRAARQRKVRRLNLRISHAIESLENRLLLTTYYVSPTGSDNNAGTSTTTPWASATKVDNTTFSPGDQILFQRGGEWHGQLTASASGNSANPITYADYGNTALAKPTFDGSDVIPNSAFTLVSGSTYSFQVPNVPGANGNAYWVYANHVGMLAASASDASSGGVQSNANSFYINGSTVYINTGGQVPSSGTVVYTLGDRGAGTNANSSLINSNSYSYVTFQNLIGRETAEVGGGNSLGGGINDGYVYRIQGGSNITLLNCEGDYGSKHIVGAIDTTGFIANGLLLQGAPEGVAGNGLPYGNATATVAYSDNDTGDTSQWINVTVQDYDSGQPAFLTHGNPNAIASILLQNFVSLGSPIALEPAAGVAITIKGGKITDNTLTAYSGTNVTELIDGMTFTGSGSAIEIYGNTTVQNCLLQGSSQSNQAIQVSGANNVVRFNTIDAGGAAAPIYLENGSTNTTIFGNIISGTGNSITQANSAATFTSDYDLFDSTYGQSLTALHAAGQEAHGIAANPAFTAPATGDFSLQSSSPAINTIPTAGIIGITSDIRGFARPSGNAYDMGAYEYQSVLHQPTIATAAAASPSIVTGTTTNLSVLGATPDGEPTLNYTWSLTGTPPAAVTYSSNGTNASKNSTVTFAAAGTYNFLVTVSNGTYSVTSSVSVTVDQVSQGVKISPSTQFVAINTTQQYSAIVADQFGNPVTGATVTYSIQSGGGSINASTGLFTAPGTTGTTIIKATSGSSSATATATVTPPNQAPTVTTPASASPNPVTSTTTTLSVLGSDQDGEASLTYTWSLVGTPPASVTYSINGTNAAKNTVATFTANGTYNFLVTITGPGNLSSTSSTTVTVNIFVPIVVDGSLDGRYGPPLAVQSQATNYGNGNLGNPIAPYSQLSAAYGVIDEPDGQLDLFLAGSLDLVNAHLNLFIDSVPGQGAANLSALASVGPWGGTGFSSVTLDNSFRPDELFTSTFGGGSALNYFNFDNGTTASNNYTDPATGLATSYGTIPYFTERVNDTAQSSIVAANTGASLTTGAEFAFNLSGLGYTTADYNAGDPIGVMALISYGSFTQATNQFLAPYTPNPAAIASNGGFYQYFGSSFDLSNNANFPGNQFFSVSPPAAASGPSVATAASATPNPVTGSSTALSVLGADPAGESSLTYTWSTTGTPPAPVHYSINGTNAAKNTTASFTANGTYNFLVTITDGSGLATTSTVTATVTGVTSTNQAPTVATAAAASASPVTGITTALSVLGADDGGESNLTYTWATTGTVPGSVNFSVNGTNAAKNSTATFTKAGTYNFIVTITDSGGLSTTSSVSVVVNQTISSITLSPPTPSVATNATQQFSATVDDQFNNVITAPAIAWSLQSGSGSINSSTGLYTAPGSTGSAVIKATAGSISGTDLLTIFNGQGPSVANPASAGTNPVGGNSTTLGVLGSDAAGEASLTYTWSSVYTPANAPPPTFSTNGTNAAKNTVVRFYQAGTYTLTATIVDPSGHLITSSVVVPVNQTVTSLYVLPPRLTVPFGQSQQYTVRARDQFSDAIASPSITWNVSGGGTITTGGLFTAGSSAGIFTVTAQSASMNASTLVTVAAGSAAMAISAVTSGSTDIGAGVMLFPNAGPVGLTTVTGLIREGFDGGAWDGTSGITSSTAADDPQHLTAVGVLLNNTGGSTPMYTSFGGTAAGPNDVLIRYTYYGDTNLDGKVDTGDYTRIDFGFLTHANSWYNGDFNYDGVVNGSDYTLIDNTFNQLGTAKPSAQAATATAPAAVFSQTPIASTDDGTSDWMKRKIHRVSLG
jgi:hypothetical protein